MRNDYLASATPLVCGLLALMPAAHGQVNGLDLSKSENQGVIRQQYKGSRELPDGLTFIATLRHFKGMQSEDAVMAEDVLQSELGLDKEDTRELLKQMSTALVDFNSRMQVRSMEVLCTDGEPREIGDKAFEALKSTDDAKAELAEQSFVHFKQGLNDNLATAFHQWIIRSKVKVTLTTFNHKELAGKARVTDVDDKMYAFCRAATLVNDESSQ